MTPLSRISLIIGLLISAPPLFAHNGPPFPMIADRRVGPCIISLWTHPDVGTGTFFVVVRPAPGMTVPRDMRYEIGVFPVSGRLKEKFYWTTPKDDSGQVHYYAWVPFDRQELWHVNLYLRSAGWNGQISGDVEVTPVGFGQWDLLFFALPFLGVGWLWFMGLKRKRRGRVPVEL
jgi:hypothetical protein